MLTRDCWGQYIFLRDEQSGTVWSAGYQPTGVEPDSYEAIFFEDHAEIIRRDRSLTTALEVVVSSEDDAEVRRISISNLGMRARDIQVTSYAELSLDAASRRCGASGFRESVRRDRIRRRTSARCSPRGASVPKTRRPCGSRT